MRACSEYLPLLGTVPALEKRNRDEDDDSLLAVASLDLEIPGVSIMPPSAHRLSNRVVPMCPNFQVRFASDGPLRLVVPFCSRLL